ncbi:MAG: tRNA guanosine(34) transglycosylase Tgt [Ardenticatenales bacterium]|nr:tRNA guanosine(34) transglycosylase Tgt [Ardenticatenales bacterium]
MAADAPTPPVFETTWTDGRARVGRLATAHGVIDTPAFVAVGTQATVKSMMPADLTAVGQQAIFCNTYHLFLRPGADVVAAQGGLHRFMGWDGPIMTDSGGFQVFSLGAGLESGVGKLGSIFPGEGGMRRLKAGPSFVRVTDDGVQFTSHLDGSRHFFTPEVSIGLQQQLGADIILAFDECTSPLHDHAYTGAAMHRTHRWAERSLAAHGDGVSPHGDRQLFYGIVQGGWYPDLRAESARFTAALAADGIAIGGSLGQTKADMHAVLDLTVPLLPADKPRHLLGIGEIPDIFAAVARGVDTFDCVAPTRMARNAGLIARDVDGERLPRFRLNLRNARYKNDPRPVDPACPCALCAGFSRAYLHHLFRCDELLAYRLATLHNLTAINRLVAEMRSALVEDRFEALRAGWLGGGQETE